MSMCIALYIEARSLNTPLAMSAPSTQLLASEYPFFIENNQNSLENSWFQVWDKEGTMRLEQVVMPESKNVTLNLILFFSLKDITGATGNTLMGAEGLKGHKVSMLIS